MYPAYQTLRTGVDNGVAVLTLANGERNAWNATVQGELFDAMRRADGDDDVRAVVLTGAGRVFSVGADMTGGALGAGAPPLGSDVDGAQFLPNQVRKPVIAAINGDAVGAGTSYPLLCDIRIVAHDAKLGFVFTKRAVVPEYGATWTTPRLVGMTRASELMLTGRIFTGAEAAEMGLATRAVPKQDVLDVAMAMATTIASDTAPQATALVKRLLWESFERTHGETVDVELAWFGHLTRQPDASEGVRSFMEKRPPEWQGKVTDLPDSPEPR
jgi:enoyl-CoA hydratase/carnithine racemase